MLQLEPGPTAGAEPPCRANHRAATAACPRRTRAGVLSAHRRPVTWCWQAHPHVRPRRTRRGSCEGRFCKSYGSTNLVCKEGSVVLALPGYVENRKARRLEGRIHKGIPRLAVGPGVRSVVEFNDQARADGVHITEHKINTLLGHAAEVRFPVAEPWLERHEVCQPYGAASCKTRKNARSASVSKACRRVYGKLASGAGVAGAVFAGGAGTT